MPVEFVGNSPATQRLRQMIRSIGAADTPVLITGETGSGKDLVARMLHESSPRATGPFMAVNVPAIPASLASSELFGHSRGAFTGAVRDKKGFLEAADGGTLLLDEVEEIPREVQAGLFAVLEEGAVRRVGDVQERRIDVRVIGTARQELGLLARESKLNLDFLHRLATTVIRVPPLRERREDIPDLVRHFLQDSQISGKPRTVTSEAMAELKNYDFPGNIRELGAILIRAAFSSESERIDTKDLDLQRFTSSQPSIHALEQEIARLNEDLARLAQTTLQAEPIWEGRLFDQEKDLAFVLMPFSDDLDLQKVYRDHVKPTLESKCGLRCERADDIYDVSGVMQSVWEGISRARLVIADLTGRNPNVFYELGIAHTLGRPVVMLTQSMDYVPFDLRHLRCIVYNYKPFEIGRFENALVWTVKAVLSTTRSPRQSRYRHESVANHRCCSGSSAAK